MISLIQRKYMNNRVKSGRLTKLIPLCCDVCADCIHPALTTLNPSTLTRSSLSACCMLRTVLGEHWTERTDNKSKRTHTRQLGTSAEKKGAEWGEGETGGLLSRKINGASAIPAGGSTGVLTRRAPALILAPLLRLRCRVQFTSVLACF